MPEELFEIREIDGCVHRLVEFSFHSKGSFLPDTPEDFHPTDGVFHSDADFRELPVRFLLRFGERMVPP